MTTTPHDTIPTPSAGTLADLRAVAFESSQSATSMIYAADCQARMLRNLLPLQADRIPTRLSDLLPSVLVDYLDNLPVPGTAFWGNDHWHIHVRAGDRWMSKHSPSCTSSNTSSTTRYGDNRTH